ncbi:DUF2243 domain-containing protein [Amycolatopsis thermoflava]|uniref:DUF2243 domain-containing protein n=1 Tax=Amycolatopsis thermoflava TaxID=84480 RepID=UPI0036693077
MRGYGGPGAFADETVFHQLLHWHHFHDKSTSDAGLVPDGLFHAFGWSATVLGLVLVAGLRRRAALSGRALLGGILAGAGAFQLYDGTIQHKLLTLHQIRYHVDLVPCEWAWKVIAVALLAAGVALLVRERAPDHTTGTWPMALAVAVALVGYLCAARGRGGAPPRSR